MACQILVVDDSECFRRAARQLLAARGLEVLAAASDGDTALAAVSADCPNGILLDINLPGRDGFAVAALIASACPDATIVLTSSEIEDVPSAVLRSCVDLFITVPLSPLASARHGATSYNPKQRHHCPAYTRRDDR